MMVMRTISTDPHRDLRGLAGVYRRCGEKYSVTAQVVYLLQEAGVSGFDYRFNVFFIPGAASLELDWDLGTIRRQGLAGDFIHPFLADMGGLEPWSTWMGVAARVVYALKWLDVEPSLEAAYGYLVPSRFFYLDPYDFRRLWAILKKHRLVRVVV